MRTAISPKAPGKRSRDGFAAQTFERCNSLLTEQNERIAIHSGSDVDNIGAGEIRRDCRGTALINIKRAGNNSLDRNRGADLIDRNRQASFGKIAAVESDE